MTNINNLSSKIFIIVLLISANFIFSSLLSKMKAKVDKKNMLLKLSSLKTLTKTKTKLSLVDMQIDTINDFAKKVTKYFRDQVPPTDRTSPWTDPLFPPTFNSLASRNADGTPVDKFRNSDIGTKESDVEWMRPNQIFDGASFALFETNISIDDIRQGTLGNCYFLSAISSLAETPQLILQLFKSLKVSPAGIYEVILRIDGEWQIVLVDDFIPVYKGTRDPIFAKPVNPEIWVMILEKAWAKVNGGYSNTIGGLPNEVFSYFTNFPSRNFNHSDYKDKLDEFWDILFKSSNNNDIVNCSTPGGDDSKNSNGIVSGHAFSLLKAIEITLNGVKVRLLRVRNPWGNFEWKGKWSDSSAEWTNETRALVGDAEVKDDGNFYIEYSDYMSYFIHTYINYFSPLNLAKTIKIPSEKSDLGMVTEFTLSKPTNCAVSLTTQQRRNNRQLKNTDAMANMILAQKQKTVTSNNPETYFKYLSAGSNGNDIILPQMEAGIYVVYSIANYKSALEVLEYDKAYPYIIQVSCNEIFDIASRGQDTDHSLARLSVISMSKSLQNIKDSGNQLVDEFDYYINNTTFAYFISFNGSSTTKNIIYTNKSTNVKMISPTEFGVNIKILPGRSYAALGSVHDRGSGHVLWLQNNLQTSTGAEIGYLNSKKFLTNATSSQYKANSNGFLFKFLNVELGQLYQKIDTIKAALDYYTAKYPDLMAYFKDLPPLNDGVPVKFTDKSVYSENSFSFREKRIDNGKDHGRIMYRYPDGTTYVGYAKNGEYDGEGAYISPEGDKYRCLYNNGELVQWL